MSDQPDPDSTELTPDQESTVRRLLAEARHDDPMPTDLADRLDRVLADLSEERSSTPVVDLAARRRRRDAGRLLVAAAALVLGGAAVGQLIGHDEGQDDSTSAGAGADSEQAPDRRSEDGSRATGPAPVPSESGALQGQESAATLSGLDAVIPLELTSQRLEQDVEDQLARLPPATVSDLTAPHSAAGGVESYSSGFGCEQPAGGDDSDELLPAYYDGVPVLLALKAAPDGTQRGELLECLSGKSLRSFSVSLR